MKALYVDGTEWGTDEVIKRLQDFHLAFQAGMTHAALCFDRADMLVTIVQGKNEEDVRVAVDSITEAKGIFSTEYIVLNTLQ